MIASAYLQFTLDIIFQNRAETGYYSFVHFKHMVIMTMSIKMSQTHISFFLIALFFPSAMTVY